jgi:predicted nuclease of predicted toxin-antitoxin system
MATHHLRGDCELIEQSILNRYPLILIECNEGIDQHMVRLRLRADSPPKMVQITTEDILDGNWEAIVDRAIRELYAM